MPRHVLRPRFRLPQGAGRMVGHEVHAGRLRMIPRPRGHGGGAGRDHGHVVVEARREPDDPDRDPVRQAFQSFHQVEARMRVTLPCRTHAVTSHVLRPRFRLGAARQPSRPVCAASQRLKFEARDLHDHLPVVRVGQRVAFLQFVVQYAQHASPLMMARMMVAAPRLAGSDSHHGTDASTAVFLSSMAVTAGVANAGTPAMGRAVSS